ncbi:MAG: methyl-accepting chemotaxis protein [Pseudomonadota bacterium]
MRIPHLARLIPFHLNVGTRLLLSFLAFGALFVFIEVSALGALGKIDTSFRKISENRVEELSYSVDLSRTVTQMEAKIANIEHIRDLPTLEAFETQSAALTAQLREQINNFPIASSRESLASHLSEFEEASAALLGSMKALVDEDEAAKATMARLEALHEESRKQLSDDLERARTDIEQRIEADGLSAQLGGGGLSPQALRTLILDEMDVLREGLTLGGAIDAQILLLRGAFSHTDPSLVEQARNAAEENLETLRAARQSAPSFLRGVLETLEAQTRGSASIFALQTDRLQHLAQLQESYLLSLEELTFLRSASTNLVESDVAGIREEAQLVSATLASSTQMLRYVSGAGVLGVLLIGVGGVWFGVTRPLNKISDVTERLSKGDLDASCEGFTKRDEFGRIAQALEVFRTQVREIDRLSHEKTHKQAELDRARAHMMSEMRTAFGEVVRRAAAGDLSVRVTAEFTDPELSALSGDINELLTQIDNGLDETASVLAAMAQADFSKRVGRTGSGAFAKLSNSTNATAEQLADLIQEIREAAREVAEFSQQISQQCDDVATESEHQSDALKESTKAIEGVSRMVAANANVADQASNSTRDVAKSARHGRATVEAAGQAVSRIAQGAKQVSGSLTVIDSIAFQTNLLALNAAVEAARAGEAGKGFAVVASEVRALAQRSADAASEIKSVLAQNKTAVEDGVKLVREAGEALSAIDLGLEELSSNVDTIALASADQSAGLEETTQTVSNIDLATRVMAENTTKSAKGATHLLGIVQRLDGLVATFRLTSNMGEGPLSAKTTTPVARPILDPAPQDAAASKAASAA